MAWPRDFNLSCVAGVMGSELLLTEAVLKEEESGALVGLLLLVGEAESALEVVLLTSENLELVELAGNELDNLGGTLLELGDALGLAEVVELGNDLGQVALGPEHEVLLGEALDFLEIELVNNIDDGLSLLFFLLLVGGDHDSLGALGDILGFGLDAGVVHNDLVGERVGEELVAADVIDEDLHSLLFLLFSVIVDSNWLCPVELWNPNYN